MIHRKGIFSTIVTNHHHFIEIGIFECFLNERLVNFEIITASGTLHEVLIRHTRMSIVIGRIAQCRQYTGTQPERTDRFDPEFQRHIVSLLKSDSSDIVNQAVGVLFKNGDSITFIFIVNTHGKTVGDIIAFKPDHDITYLALVFHGLDNGIHTLLSDTTDFAETFRFVVHHLERLLAERLNNHLGKLRADILD